MNVTNASSVFFAYASQPASCGEAMTTAATSLTETGTPSTTWQNLQPGGRVLIDTITEAIDSRDVVVAEVSSMNRNVLFEAGYALAKNKGLLFAMDESLKVPAGSGTECNSSRPSVGWTITATDWT